MKCTILHEGKGRMRVHVEKVRMTLHRADVLEAYLNHHDAIVHAAVYERTGDVVITYTGKRTAAIAILAGYKFDVAEYDALVRNTPRHGKRPSTNRSVSPVTSLSNTPPLRHLTMPFIKKLMIISE